VSLCVDLNTDAGESFGNWTMGRDEEMAPYLTSMNVACGFHAGDPSVMRRTVALALRHGIALGAHPGFLDLQGFGRRRIDLSPEEAHDFVVYQVGALAAFARVAGTRLTHVALHGAMAGLAKSSAPVAEAIMHAIAACDPTLAFIGMPGLPPYEAARRLGLPVVTQVPIDLDLRGDGNTVLERKKKAADPLRVVERALKTVRDGKMETVEGDRDVRADILLIHSDAPNVLDVARALHEHLAREGVSIRPFPERLATGPRT